MSDVMERHQRANARGLPAFSFRGGQELLADQGGRLQPPVHPCGRHGDGLLGDGIHHLAGKATQKK